MADENGDMPEWVSGAIRSARVVCEARLGAMVPEVVVWLADRLEEVVRERDDAIAAMARASLPTPKQGEAK